MVPFLKPSPCYKKWNNRLRCASIIAIGVGSGTPRPTAFAPVRPLPSHFGLHTGDLNVAQMSVHDFLLISSSLLDFNIFSEKVQFILILIYVTF
jgi:hypothetical protein